MNTSVFLQGMGLCASLIMAIGAQNAHILKIGILRQHVLPTIAVCIVLDCLLLTLGVNGMGAIIGHSPGFLTIARWGGALFLCAYGMRSLWQVFQNNALQLGDTPLMSRRNAIITVLTLSLLNPHVYLDTVVLIGSIGGQQAPESRASFLLGACLASTLWFISLGLGARMLAPLFKKPLSWKILDLLIGFMMLGLAWMLIGS